MKRHWGIIYWYYYTYVSCVFLLCCQQGSVKDYIMLKSLFLLTLQSSCTWHKMACRNFWYFDQSSLVILLTICKLFFTFSWYSSYNYIISYNLYASPYTKHKYVSTNFITFYNRLVAASVSINFIISSIQSCAAALTNGMSATSLICAHKTIHITKPLNKNRRFRERTNDTPKKIHC